MTSIERDCIEMEKILKSQVSYLKELIMQYKDADPKLAQDYLDMAKVQIENIQIIKELRKL